MSNDAAWAESVQQFQQMLSQSWGNMLQAMQPGELNKAMAMPPSTPVNFAGDKLLELLERRLDNFVFRAGFAPTAVAARQLVRHKHVLLNGRAVNIPSIRIRPGDRIQLTERARSIPVVVESLAEPALARPEWLVFDEAALAATVTRTPAPDEVPFPVDVQQVVEYYAVRL